MKPKSIAGPIVVERHDNQDGSIAYEIWDHGKDTCHQICCVTEHTSDNAKAEADFIALSLNNTLGAFKAIEHALTA